MQELEAQLEQTRIAVEENNEHVKVLSEHLGNVRQEIGYTQGRVCGRAGGWAGCANERKASAVRGAACPACRPSGV